VDRKAPVVSCGSDDGSWHNANVTITCTATDGGSDLADPADASFTLSTSVAAGDEDGNASTDSHDVADAVSNRATAGPITGIKVDRKAPTLTWSAGAGESFHFGAALTAPTCTAVDIGSGVPGGCSVSGFSTAVGTHTLVASATDLAGNLATETRIYTVLPWTLDGYYQPVNLAALNAVKAGSTVPLKFNVRRDGQTITDPAVLGARFGVVRTACPNEPLDPFEGFLSSGGTTLRYDPIGGQWIQNWATPKTAVGTCWKVTMTAADGSSISADFKLK
ncbi:MAG: PxKF domain-containing protein, partial [Nocardioidaceae bacterium]